MVVHRYASFVGDHDHLCYLSCVLKEIDMKRAHSPIRKSKVYVLLAILIVGTIVFSLVRNAESQNLPYRQATETDLIGKWKWVSGANLNTRTQTTPKKGDTWRVFNKDGTTASWYSVQTGSAKSIDAALPGLLEAISRKGRYSVKAGTVAIDEGPKKYMLGAIYFTEDIRDPQRIAQFMAVGKPEKGDLLLVYPGSGQADLMRKEQGEKSSPEKRLVAPSSPAKLGSSRVHTETGWQMLVGTRGFDSIQSLAATEDGGFIAVGYSAPGNPNRHQYHPSEQALVAKFNEEGKLEWHILTGGDDSERLRAVAELRTGEYVAVGHSRSSLVAGQRGSGADDVYVLVISAEGNTVQQKLFGESGYDQGVGIVAHQDSSFTVAAYSVSSDHRNRNNWLIKFNRTGETLSKKELTAPDLRAIRGLYAAPDGGLVAIAEAAIRDIQVLKLREDGDVIWAKTYSGGRNAQDVAYSAIPTNDGGYAVAAWSQQLAKPREEQEGAACLLKFSAKGEFVWERRFGKMAPAKFSDLAENTDGSIIAIGDVRSEKYEEIKGYGFDDYFLVMVDKNGAFKNQRLLGNAGPDFDPRAVILNNGIVVIGGASLPKKLPDLTGYGGVDAFFISTVLR